MQVDKFKGTLFDQSGRVAIITGSSKGMGGTIAKRFVEHGSKVVISSRNQEECDAYAALLNKEAGCEVAYPIAADMLNIQSLENLVDSTVSHFGRLDTLISCAPVYSYGREDQVSPEEFTRTFEGTVRNNAILCSRAFPYLKESGKGNIILVGSVSAYMPTDTMSVYAISKRALMQMMENMAFYLGKDNIRVNCLVPGFIRTEGSRPLWESEEGMALGKASSPLNRIGECDDIAGCALFLASDAGNFTTGQSVVVDGGSTLMGGIANSVKPDEFIGGVTK